MLSSSPEPKNLKTLSGIVAAFLGFNLFVSAALAAGTVEWSPASGLAVANATSNYALGTQTNTQIVRSDYLGTEFYFVLWMETDYSKICAQKYDAAGVAQWTPDTPACPKEIYGGASGLGSNTYYAVADGSGGLTVAWSTVTAVYMNRIDRNGTIYSSGNWTGTSSGMQVGNGAGFGATLHAGVSDGAAGMTVIYSGPPSNSCLSCDKIFVLRVDQNANPLWEISPYTSLTGGIDMDIISVADNDSDTLPDYIIEFVYTVGNVTMRINSSDGTIPSPWDTFLQSYETDFTYDNSVAHPGSASDGAGGAYYVGIAWDTGSPVHLFVTNRDKNGTYNPGFPSNLPVEIDVTSDGSFYNSEIRLINDGGTGVIVVYNLYHPGTTTYEIKAAHINSAGTLDWGGSAVTVSSGLTTTKNYLESKLTSTGDLYVAWVDSRNSSPDIYGQLIDGTTGVLSFASDVQLTNLTSTDQLNNRVTNDLGAAEVDNNNELLVVWSQSDAFVDNYMQRFDGSDGSVDFTASGQRLAGTTDNPIPQSGEKIITTSDGDFIIFWQDQQNEAANEWAIFAEKFDPSGTPLWNSANPGFGTQITTYPNDGYYGYDVAADQNGGAIIVWSSFHTGSHTQLFGQRINSDGTLAWDTGVNPQGYGTNVTPVADVDLKGYNDPAIIADGSNSVFVTYTREQFPSYYPGALHVDGSSGTVDAAWNGGLPLDIDTLTSGSRSAKHIVLDGSGGIIVGYTNGSFTGITLKALRLGSTGNFVWLAPVTIATLCMTSCSTIYGMAADGASGAIFGYHSNFGLTDFDIFAQRIDSGGSLLWTGSTPNGADIARLSGSNQLYPRLVSDNVSPANGAIIVWEDYRTSIDAPDIFAQRIDSSGTAAWTTNGINISNGVTGSNNLGEVVSNGSHGAIISYSGPVSVYAQHINGAGTPQWTDTVGGILVDSGAPATRDDAAFNYTPVLAGDGNAGAVISWVGNDTDIGSYFGNDVFAQYISDTIGAGCSEITANGFCGTQVIADAILTFTSIPASFSFPTVTSSGSVQNVFNNDSAASQPDSNDLVGILDTRNSGGFEFQLQKSTTFTNGTDVLPNLFVATSVSSPVYTVPNTDPATSCPGTDCGIIYGSSVTTRGISAPADSGGADLGVPGTYTINLSSGPAVLIGAQLSAASGYGTDANFYQYINYRLPVPAAQPAGNYAVILTFTLFDDTTP